MKALVTWLAIMAATAVWLAVMVITMGRSYGAQLDVALGYTFAVGLQVFLATRIGEGFDLRDERVRHQLPKLLVTHLAFLVSVLTALAISKRYEPNYSRWLFQMNRKGVSNLVFLQIMTGTCIVMIQVLWSRLILARAVGYKDWSFWEGCWRRAKPRNNHPHHRSSSRTTKGKAHTA